MTVVVGLALGVVIAKLAVVVALALVVVAAKLAVVMVLVVVAKVVVVVAVTAIASFHEITECGRRVVVIVAGCGACNSCPSGEYEGGCCKAAWPLWLW